MKIVGRYVCQVEIDLSIDESTKGLLPFEVIHEKFTGDVLTDTVREIISDELIEGDEGTVTVTKMYGDVYKAECLAEIDAAPTIEPERKKGKWLELTNGNHTYVCSVCGRMLVNITDGKNNVAKNYPYCNCGADMRGGQDEQTD